MLLPLSLYLFAFDIYGFVSPRPYEYYQIGMPIVFFYIACAYIFQAIYHYYNPIPMVIQMIEEVQQEEQDNKQREESANQLLEEGESESDDDDNDSNEQGGK